MQLLLLLPAQQWALCLLLRLESLLLLQLWMLWPMVATPGVAAAAATAAADVVAAESALTAAASADHGVVAAAPAFAVEVPLSKAVAVFGACCCCKVQVRSPTIQATS